MGPAFRTVSYGRRLLPQISLKYYVAVFDFLQKFILFEVKIIRPLLLKHGHNRYVSIRCSPSAVVMATAAGSIMNFKIFRSHSSIQNANERPFFRNLLKFV